MQFKTRLLPSRVFPNLKTLGLVIVSVFAILLMAHPVFAKNMAVMPFENLAKGGMGFVETNEGCNLVNGSDNNWIGAGFAETLTTKLCKVKEVNLLEREQLSKILDEIKFQKSGLVDESTAVKTGKMHGVDVMVFGSYQVMGDSLRVSARFVDVETRKVIETAEATGKVDDIFKLQDNIAFSLMDSLKIVLAEKEKKEVKVNPTEDLTAYQWFSKGQYEYNLKLYDKAIEMYRKAISTNSKYANAYFIMADAYSREGDSDNATLYMKKAASLGSKEAKKYLKTNNMVRQ